MTREHGITDSPLYKEDLAPVSASDRNRPPWDITEPSFFGQLYTHTRFVSPALSGLVYPVIGVLLPQSTKEIAS